MRKICLFALAAMLAITAAACHAETEEEPFLWSGGGTYLISALQGTREIRNEEEAETYAKELWPLMSPNPLPEGRREMSVDRTDNSYHFGIFDDEDRELYSANFLSNGLIQEISFSDDDTRWYTEGKYTIPKTLISQPVWEKVQAKLGETIEKLDPGILTMVGPMQIERIIDVGDKAYLIISAPALDETFDTGLNLIAIVFPDGECQLQHFSCYGAG